MRGLLIFFFLVTALSLADGQRATGDINTKSSVMVHPGISHKKSDLDRMKFNIKAGINPWKSSFDLLAANSYASCFYPVQGRSSVTLLNSTVSSEYNKFKFDGLAAYYNALMWYFTGDQRHAEKAIEIFTAWSNLTGIKTGGTDALDAGRVIWKMLEAAEIIKNTYSGWNQADINKFKAMLVYPGYSTTTEPTAAISGDNATFYWMMYNGDPGRHGNQGLFAMRGIMAMGIFLDNRVMYERALRYLKGLPHRLDDLPYPSGPPITTTVPGSGSNIYFDEYTLVSPYRETTITDYGYNELISNYIWENGQCQESSRDQGHAFGGVSLVISLCEIAWNQGDDIYSILNNRPLLGIEYALRYNVSLNYTFPDQTSPWEPTSESGEFIQKRDRTGRWFSKKINPWNANDLTRVTRGTTFKSGSTPIHEEVLAHYQSRMGLPDDAVKWTKRARDISFAELGEEQGGFDVDHPGWGGLAYRRPSYCAGDPVNGFSDTIPLFSMNVLPATVEAVNFDDFTTKGEGFTYHDLTPGNQGGAYRNSDNVDIQVCSEGGYNLTDLVAGEWLNYTVYVPTAFDYTLSIRYAAANGNGKIKFTFAGTDKTGEVTVPFGSPYSTGLTDWQTFNLPGAFNLEKGVQSMRILISGDSDAFILKSVTIESSGNIPPVVSLNEPATGAKFIVDSLFSLSAEAEDPDGNISIVEFYNGAVKIGEDNTTPYTIQWSSNSTGSYQISALATDNEAISTVSPISDVTIITGGSDHAAYYTFDHTPEDAFGKTGAALYSGGPKYVNGNVNSALSLDGTDAFASLPAGIVSSLVDFTIATWIYIDEHKTWARIFDFGINTSLYMYLTASSGLGTPRFSIKNGGSEIYINSSNPLPEGKWTHIAVTRLGNRGRLFINGEISGATSTLTITPSNLGITTRNYLGKSQYSDPFLSGIIDDFRIYNRELDASEIEFLADSARFLNLRPVVSIIYPSDSAKFFKGDTVNIEAAASDIDGTIVKVEFYRGLVKIGEDFTSPYTLSWINPNPGIYSLTVVATDNIGTTKISSEIGINISESSGIGDSGYEMFKCYPNPARDVIVIENCFEGKFEIFNTQGILMLTGQINEDYKTISIKDLSPGLYIVRITGSRVVENKKIIKD